MKKTTLILIMILTVACAFATTKPHTAAGEFDFDADAFTPEYGGWLYEEPSEIYGKKLVIQIPSVSVTTFNGSQVLSDKTAAKYLSQILSFKFTRNNIFGLVAKFADNVGTNKGLLANADMQFGFSVDNFAISVNSQASFKSYTDTVSSVASVKIYPEVNVAAMAGYSLRVIENSQVKIDVGLSAGVAFRFYSEAVDAEDIINKNEKKYTSGYAVPINISASFRFRDDLITIKTALTNINGIYYMKEFDDIEDVSKQKNGTGSYKLKTPASFNFALVVDPGLTVINPTLTFEFNGINKFLSDELSKSNYELLKYIKLKGSVEVYKAINAYLSFDGGYFAFGGSVGYKGILLSVDYGWSEAGTVLGEKPVDYLTIGVKLGWDKN